MASTDHIKAVLFDIGDTLIDFTMKESWDQVSAGIDQAHTYLKEIGIHPPGRATYGRRYAVRLIRALVWAKFRKTEVNSVLQLRRLHERMGIDLTEAQLLELGRRFYRPTLDITTVAPGSASTIATLQQRGYVMALVSNTFAPPSGLDDLLKEHGLLDYFDVRIYSCVVGVPKPNPRIFQTALSQIGIDAAHAVYVGNKPRIDVAGAQRVGMTTVLRHRGPGPVPPGPRPDHLIREIPELLDWLPGLPSVRQ